MEELINLLHSGGYSCVIANGDNIRTFTQRGVADLYDLLTQEPDFLKGASIADKVVRSEERRVGKECRSRWSPYH